MSEVEWLSPLPVITARCADRRDRGYLAWVAVAGEVATLVLETAPIDASTHALEIHVEGFDEPLVVLAEPVGEPTDEGFPLRLRPLDANHAEALQRELFGADRADAPPMRERMASASFGMRAGSEPPPMSTRHREALAKPTGPASSTRERRAPGMLTGRVIGDGRFALESLIGAGANGEVYRGTHTALRRPIAVKVLHPSLQHSADYCARFYSEALAASQLDHRNVLRIVDYGQEPDGLLYIVMELLEGRSLQQILDEAGVLPLERTVHLVAQACAGLAHAHDAGVVHRDIKPENIVVVERRDDEGNETEIVKVCDFGIAQWSPDRADVGDEDPTIVNRPDPATVVGTPAYMAPEQIRNEKVDARTDIYALGVVLYELATGRVPFDAPRPLEVLAHHLTLPPPLPHTVHPEVDRELEKVILRALAKDPAERFPNARALRTALREVIDEGALAPSGQFRRVSLRNLLSEADFLERPADAIGQLTTTSDPGARSVGIQAMGDAIRSAIGAANPKLAKDLFAWLRARAADPGIRTDERDQVERALRALKDPQAMRSLAADILSGKLDPIADLTPLLVAGGPLAALALVDGRKAGTASLELRSRFVAALRAIGPGALPVIASQLEPLVPLASRADEALAEDLLRAAPEVRSDSAGEIAVRFVRLDKPSIGTTAVGVTAALWGRRSQALLLGVLDSQSDVMRLAAIQALRKLGALDAWALDRLARLVTGQLPATDEVRVAAAEAFGAAATDTRSKALDFLHARLAPAHGLIHQVRSVFGPKESAAVTVALARSMVQLDASGAREGLQRLAAARPDLRVELETLLAQR